LEKFNLLGDLSSDKINLIQPQGYIEFLKLMKESACIISDSGGVQIESSFLGVPCLTLRETTELKLTLQEGTNQLLPLDSEVILAKVKDILSNTSKMKIHKSDMWDGNASERIVQLSTQFLNL
jgi:UDP-N-acetylglucosamine 2-epimerase (non-hydrolysing)